MSLGKRLFIGEADAAAAATSETADIFGDSSGLALYTLDYDASDESGNYDGTPTDVEFGVDGQINWGASFNGSSSKITLPSGSPFNDSDTIKCISAWIKPNTTTSNVYIFSMSSTTESKDYFTFDWIQSSWTGVPDLRVRVQNGGSSNRLDATVGVSATDDWVHVVAQLGSSEVELYINGVKQTVTHTTSGNATNSWWISNINYDTAETGLIGQYRYVSGLNADGTIDQVRIFNKALSQNEVNTLNLETATVHTATTDTVNYQGTNLAYYKLDNTALDETSNNHDGTESDITYEFGRYGQAAVFNGSSSYIQTTLSPSVAATSHSFWMNPTSSTDSRTPLYFDNRGGRIDVVVGGDANDTPEASNELVIINSSTYNNQWVHIVIVCTGWASSYTSGAYGSAITAKIYINGVLEGTVSPTPYGQTTGMRIGRSGGSYYFQGRIDQVRIYNSELDATAVANLYAEKQAYITKDGSDPFGDNSEISFYDFESNAGNTSQDATGNNDAYFTSGVTFTSGSGLFGTYAAYLNGTSGYIQYNVLAGITTDYSFSLWAIPHASNNFNFISTDSSTAVTTNLIRFSLHQNGNYYFEFGNTSSGRMTGATPSEWRDGNWHHFTWVSSSTEKHFYVDGSLYNSISSTSGVSNLSTVTMGYYGTNYASGYYDQVRVFDRALDGDEVFKLYAEVIN